MATNHIQENLKKYFYSGVGLAAHTADVVQKSVHELIKKGKLNKIDGKKIVADAIKKIEARRPEIEARYNDAVHKFVKTTATEMTKLQKRIVQLEDQLKVKTNTHAGKPAKTATKKKTIVKKNRPARKTTSKVNTPVETRTGTAETTNTTSNETTSSAT